MPTIRGSARALLVAALGVSFSSASAAATDSAAVLREQVDELQSTVARQQDLLDELAEQHQEDESFESEIGSERSDFHPSRSWRKLYGISDIRVDVHGFINLEFIDAGPDGSESGHPTFDLHHVNVFVDALLHPNLRSHVEIEFEHAFEDVEIDQAFLAWGIADWLTFTAGRFYAPFGIERFVWYPSVNHLVSRPTAFRQIIPGNFYQHGLMLSGDVGPSDQLRFTYEVSVSNGLGGTEFESDPLTSRRSSRQSRNINTGLAVTGRLAAVFWPWVEVGASVHHQKFRRTGGDPELLFLGADTAARWQGFELRAEYVYAKLDRAGLATSDTFAAFFTTDLYQAGWYAQLGYTLDVDCRFLESTLFVARVGQIELDRHASDEQTHLSLGAAFEIYQHFRIKTEYRFAFENGPSMDNDAFLAGFVVDF